MICVPCDFLIKEKGTAAINNALYLPDSRRI